MKSRSYILGLSLATALLGMTLLGLRARLDPPPDPIADHRLGSGGPTAEPYFLDRPNSPPRRGPAPVVARVGHEAPQLLKTAEQQDDSTLEQARTIIGLLEQTLITLQPTLEALPELTASLQRLLGEDNLKHITRILAHLDQASGHLVPLSQDLQQLTTRANRFITKTEKASVQGAQQLSSVTLPELNNLLRELGRISRSLNRLLSELEQQPQSALLDLPQGPPGPGESGFDPEE
jgi:hypothetical protein